MRRNREQDPLFFEGDLSAVVRSHLTKVHGIVGKIPEKRLLAVPDEKLFEEVMAQMRITPLKLDEENRHMTRDEIQVDVSGDPRRVFRRDGPAYVAGFRVTIVVPYRGDSLLWRLKPNSWRPTFPYAILRQTEGEESGEIIFVVEYPADEDPAIVKQRYERTMDDVRFYIQAQKEQLETELTGLPEAIRAALRSRRDKLKSHDDKLAELLGIPIKQPASAAMPRNTAAGNGTAAPVRTREKALLPSNSWDVFVSHASEDKDSFARPLAEALREEGLAVWFDEFTLSVGDSLRRSIDQGLARARFGIVIISPSFLKKEWPQKELDGLVAREVEGHKVILPVWHQVTPEIVRGYSPTLADRLATSSSRGLNRVVEELLEAIQHR